MLYPVDNFLERWARSSQLFYLRGWQLLILISRLWDISVRTCIGGCAGQVGSQYHECHQCVFWAFLECSHGIWTQGHSFYGLYSAYCKGEHTSNTRWTANTQMHTLDASHFPSKGELQASCRNMEFVLLLNRQQLSPLHLYCRNSCRKS